MWCSIAVGDASHARVVALACGLLRSTELLLLMQATREKLTVILSVYQPGQLLAAYKVASDASIDANTQLALKAGQLVYEATGKRVVVLVPDGPEYDRSSNLFKTSLEMSEGVDMGHLFEGREPLGKVCQLSSNVLR